MRAERRRLLERRTGGLSRSSQMPGWSYGLPGDNVATKAVNVHYHFPNVVAAQQRRLKAVKFSPTWAQDMIELIGSKREKYFRWHDTGDVQSLTHLTKIAKVCAGLPEYRFWLPTQKQQLVESYQSMVGGFPENLTVRLSTPGPSTAPHSYIVASNPSCPAERQGNRCGACRACWNKEINYVTYQRH